MSKPILLRAAALRCASGANCVSYSTLGEPSKLSRGNPGARCFACEKQRKYFEVDAAAAKLKATKPRQVKGPSRSKDYDPKVRRETERFSERATTERAGAAAVGHQHMEVSHASAIRERRRASVLSCKRGLQSAIVSGDVRLTRRWSRSLRDAEARLLWAESDLEASQKRAQSEQSLRYYQSRMEDMSLKDAPSRLASFIVHLIECEGVVSRRGPKIPTHYTHEYLGTVINANRETVTRAFARLQDEGVVELHRRHIYVTDMEALQRIAGGLVSVFRPLFTQVPRETV